MKEKKVYIPETIERQTTIAQNICRIHGQGHVAQGKSGSVLYIPCPSCLKVYGKREIGSRHLAVVLDKTSESGRKNVAYCMKHSAHTFTLSDLLSFPPLSVRIPGYVQQTAQVSLKQKKYPLLDLGNGVRIPYPPGETIPISKCSKDHVAIKYLEGRGYNPLKLEAQFGCCWCEKELTPDKENGVFYRKWEGGFQNTPQHRIIFQALMNGIPVGWQGRLLDTYTDEGYFIKHPYTGEWELVANRVGVELVFIPPYNGVRRKLAKYNNALGMVSSEVLFGYDSFIEKNKTIPLSQRVAVLTEGPLDAARFPANGLAYTRAHVSPAQARLASALAGTVVLAYDNDAAGKEYLVKNMATLSEYCTNVLMISPEPYKDFGEAGKAFSTKTLKATLNQ